MSLARQFFREFRPLFRMLEEPLGRHPGFTALPSRVFLDDPFFNASLSQVARPAVDVTEEGDQYVVEAELPGVKREDIDVRIGDGGRSVTIEGKIVQRSALPAIAEAATTTVDVNNAATEGSEPSATTVAKQEQPSNQLSVERTFSGSTTFTRTVYLPRPVDANGVSAKLADGILTLRIPRAEELGSVKINVE
ncbi:HSP20-like chaperone [Amylostereum chailletii]|nr:HSP20-like chaperone [Amylostereum chailletii]